MKKYMRQDFIEEIGYVYDEETMMERVGEARGSHRLKCGDLTAEKDDDWDWSDSD